jgi:UDP-glucose 4-epimerase
MTEVKKTLLITGVSGFIGAYVAAAAQREGWPVIGIDRIKPSQPVLDCLTEFQPASLGRESIVGLIQRHAPAVCIHCAGQASVPQSFEIPLADFEAGPQATIALFEQLRKHAPQCRVVMLSSAAVYGNPRELPIHETHAVAPLSPYGWHKLIAEQLCREYHNLFNLPVAIVRIFSAYGEGLRRQVCWDLCEKFAQPSEVVLQGTGVESRDFIHASDIAQGLLAVAERGQMNGRIYNLANGEEVQISQVAEQIRTALGMAERSFHFSGDLPLGTPVRWRADITSVRQLRFAPAQTFATGIANYVMWWKNQRFQVNAA